MQIPDQNYENTKMETTKSGTNIFRTKKIHEQINERGERKWLRTNTSENPKDDKQSKGRNRDEKRNVTERETREGFDAEKFGYL